MNTSLVPSVPQPSADPQRGALSVTSGSGLTTHEITDGLEYIATSPTPEFGGFHPNTVRIAKGALEEIARLRDAYKRLHSQVGGYLSGREWDHWRQYNEPRYAPEAMLCPTTRRANAPPSAANF